MALINCPECNHEISDKAISCPRCAFPLASSKEVINSEISSVPPVQTIELTGKDLKKKSLVGFIIVIIGLFVLLISIFSGFLTGAFIGFAGVIIGAIYYFVIDTKIWYQHK